MTPGIAIDVAGLSKSYGSVRALDDVSLSVERGSIVGLVGPNGAGKTTMIRVLVGALPFDAGTVTVMGHDPRHERRAVRANIGYMPQTPVLYADLTVAENVEFFAAGHHLEDARSKVRAVLDTVELGPLANRPVRTLSGGQQQRASLAAALVHEPSVVFLDEPTAGVDPELRRTFWEWFRSMAERGTTLVISTHQMDEVVHCDRVALLRRGRVIADSAPGALFESGGATVRLVTENGSSDYRVASLADDLPAILEPQGLNGDIRRIEIRGPTLEEIILDIIEKEHSE